MNKIISNKDGIIFTKISKNEYTFTTDIININVNLKEIINVYIFKHFEKFKQNFLDKIDLNFINKDELFTVILADELLMPKKDQSKNFLKQMIEDLSSKPDSSSFIGVEEVDISQVSKYGIIKNDGVEKIIDMVEKPSKENAPSNLAIMGRYILQPKIFEYLEKFQIGSGGEIQLTDSLREMCKEHPFFYKKNTQKRFDCGNVLGYLEANIAFALNDDSIKEEVKNIIKKYQE